MVDKGDGAASGGWSGESGKMAAGRKKGKGSRKSREGGRREECEVGRMRGWGDEGGREEGGNRGDGKGAKREKHREALMIW